MFCQIAGLSQELELLITLTSSNNNMDYDSMSTIMTRSGNWNWSLLRRILPQDLVEWIRYIDPSNLERRGGTNSGYFTISNAFDLLAGTNNVGNMETWQYIWNLSVPEQIHRFIWMVHHKGIKPNKYLSLFNLRNPLCEDCIGEEVTILHVMRDCRYAKPIWLQMLAIIDINIFFEVNLYDWLEHNLQMKLGGNDNWHSLWAIACH